MLMACSGNSLYRSLRDAHLPISVRNELRAMQSLLLLASDYLGQYPTTFEQDVECLQHGSLAPFSNERHALIQVKGEKEVLLFLQDFAMTSIALLQATDYRHFDDLLEQVRTSKHSLIYQHAKATLGRLLVDEQRRAETRRRKMDLTRPTVV
jgi:hypothetical protein